MATTMMDKMATAINMSQAVEVGYHNWCDTNNESDYRSMRAGHYTHPSGWAVVETVSSPFQGEDDPEVHIDRRFYPPGSWVLENTWGSFGSRGGKWITEKR